MIIFMNNIYSERLRILWQKPKSFDNSNEIEVSEMHNSHVIKMLRLNMGKIQRTDMKPHLNEIYLNYTKGFGLKSDFVEFKS